MVTSRIIRSTDRMRAAIMRVKAVRRVGKTTEPRQEKVAAVVFGDVISRFYTSEGFLY